ncbi:MAG: aminoacyltransferase [Chloroflexi bacterium]|nr:aminoacyltransferase [Chloroflexota bacterium]
MIDEFESSGWDAQITSLSGVHILQTWEWAQVKARVGWQSYPRLWWQDRRPQAGALVLQRGLSLPGIGKRMQVLYVPKGPMLDWQNESLRKQILDDLQDFARQKGAIFLKIDPDVLLGTGIPGTPESRDFSLGAQIEADLRQRGWLYSSSQVQFRNSVWIDLTPEEDQLLARMKPKTRYNIRLSERKGVQIRVGTGDDLPALYRMYAETSVRDGFAIRDEAYYRCVWETFLGAGLAEVLIAEVEGEPAAAVVVFRFAGRAWYLYGMSRQVHREKMPNVLLQWEAIRRAKEAGCAVYDLWGAPDLFDPSDPLWGVYRFKEGLGGQVVRTLGAWDYPVQPWLYRLYTQTLPKALDIMRSRGRRRTQQTLSP